MPVKDLACQVTSACPVKATLTGGDLVTRCQETVTSGLSYTVQ